jgi:two-component sensor histidine kinase
LAQQYEYRGCWSFPIETTAGTVAGTFAMYFRDPREPALRDYELAKSVTQAAAIIISRHQETIERRQAEERQRLLLGELNHRVKNTLASVQSIVQMTLRHTKDPTEIAKAFAGRVQSLARVHSILTDTSWKGADLRSLIHDQLLSGVMDEKQLAADGPDVHLPPQIALHLALILHELGTNAAKYGALSAGAGSLPCTGVSSTGP